MLLMAVVNRRSGMTSGLVKPYQPMSSFAWKGIQIVRNYGRIGQVLSLSTATVKAKMTEFANRFRDTLTDSQRNGWDQYAGMLGSAVDREASDNVSRSKNVIPHNRRKLQSGINAYVGANIDGYLAGMATPLDTPPIGEHTPPPPLTVAVTYATGTANVTFTDPILVGTPLAKSARLWAHFQGGKKIHGQLVAHIPLPSGAGTSFTELRTGHGWGFSPKMSLSDLGSGILRVQMDTIVQRKAGQAPLIGPGSNVAEAKVSN